MACTWLEDDGLRYLHLDYREEPVQEWTAHLAEAVRAVEAEPPGVLLLIEVDERLPTSDFLAAVKAANHDVFGPRRTVKVYVGAEGVRRTIVRGLNTAAPTVQGLPFRSRELALRHLHRLATDGDLPGGPGQA